MAGVEPTAEPSGVGRVYVDPSRPLSELTEDEIRELAGALFDAIRPDR